MNLNITQLLVWATKRTFSAMLDWQIDHLEDGDLEAVEANISGIVGLSGDLAGSIVLFLPERLAVDGTAKLLGEPVSNMNGEVVDTIGELTNIIAGGAKSRMELTVNLSLPTVITGGQQHIAYDSQAAPSVVLFSCCGQTFGVKYCINSPVHVNIAGAATQLAL